MVKKKISYILHYLPDFQSFICFCLVSETDQTWHFPDHYYILSSQKKEHKEAKKKTKNADAVVQEWVPRQDIIRTYISLVRTKNRFFFFLQCVVMYYVYQAIQQRP